MNDTTPYWGHQVDGALLTGIPSQDEYVKQYCQHVGRSFPIAKWHFYLAFSAFRLAGITQGVYKRFLQGNASSTTAGIYGEVTKLLASSAWNLVQAAEAGQPETASSVPGTVTRNSVAFTLTLLL